MSYHRDIRSVYNKLYASISQRLCIVPKEHWSHTLAGTNPCKMSRNRFKPKCSEVCFCCIKRDDARTYCRQRWNCHRPKDGIVGNNGSTKSKECQRTIFRAALAYASIAIVGGCSNIVTRNYPQGEVWVDRIMWEGIQELKGPIVKGIGSLTTRLVERLPCLCQCIGHNHRQHTHAWVWNKVVLTSVLC